MVAPKYLTVKEAALDAQVCVTIIYAWVSAGILPAYRMGSPGRRGKILIAPEDLRATKESFKTAPPVTKMTVARKTVTRSSATEPPALKHLTLD